MVAMPFVERQIAVPAPGHPATACVTKRALLRPPWLKLGLAALIFVLSMLVSVELLRRFPSASQFWLPPGILSGLLLLAPRRHWPHYLASYLVPGTLLYLVYDYSLAGALARTLTTGLEAVLLAHLLAADRELLREGKDRLVSWMRFAVLGVILAPAIGSIPGSLIVMSIRDTDLLSAYKSWFFPHAMAIGFVVPMMLRLQPAQLQLLRRKRLVGEALLLLAAFAAAAIAIFAQGSALPLFLLAPFLIVILFRVGFAGLVAAMGLLTMVSIGALYLRSGPFIAMAPSNPWWGAAGLSHVFLLILFGTMVLIASLLAERQRLNSQVDLNANAYRFIAENAGDVIAVESDDGRREIYKPLSGRLAALALEALGGPDWQTRIHPEDLSELLAARAAMKAGRAEAEATYRLRCESGDHIWLETRYRQIAPSGGGQRRHGIVSMTRDVTERKLRERRLEDLNAELETMAGTDALTGIANRRRFNEVRRQEWQRAWRQRAPLALLIVDIDNFKLFNDSYGHAAGDDCIMRIAAAIRATLARPADFCARFGGEEFAVLLPDASNLNAFLMAQRLCEAVRACAIPHAGSEFGVVTVSVGFAALYPMGEDDGILFDAADAALYRAKQAGRNRAEGAVASLAA
jgi:diguanylate cyclase (GGDEF)-like protein/PAS domain S-box-containing protein